MEEEIMLSQRETQSEVSAAEENSQSGEIYDPVPEEAAMPSDSDREEIHPGSLTGAASGIPEESADISERPPVVRVKFNKRERTYTTEEAAPLVEMGLKWDSFRPQHEKLRYIAVSQGKSVGELIDQLLNDSDGQLYRQLMDECGGNETAAGRLFEAQKAERQQRFEQSRAGELEQERQDLEELQSSLEQRLADDFLMLINEVPGRFGGFEDVPAAVVESAVEDHLSLFDAYLRYEYRESRRAAAAQAKQMLAADRSAGPLGGAKNAPEIDLDSFERAFHTALR